MAAPHHAPLRRIDALVLSRSELTRVHGSLGDFTGGHPHRVLRELSRVLFCGAVQTVTFYSMVQCGVVSEVPLLLGVRLGPQSVLIVDQLILRKYKVRRLILLRTSDPHLVFAGLPLSIVARCIDHVHWLEESLGVGTVVTDFFLGRI